MHPGRQISASAAAGLRNRDIICLSTHYWDEPVFRKQIFMSHFARHNRILYVEPSFSMARRSEAYLRGLAGNRMLRARLERREENLYLFKPPRGIPKWTDPRVERLNYRWFGELVGRAAEGLGFRDAVAWVYRPGYYFGLKYIPHRHLVFDLVDDLAAYGGEERAEARSTVRPLDGLVSRCDLLVVTAATLLERYGHAAKRVEFVPNGFDARRFSPECAGRSVPAALAELPRPLVGFIGTIFPFLDFELLQAVSRKHSDKSFVLVGPVAVSARKELDRLVGESNVFHVDAQPQDAIPSFVASFDVCLSFFRRGRVADGVSPLKVYEYLAMGKPVVSSPMRSLQEESVGSAVAFAGNADEFAGQIERCLREDSPVKARQRRAAVRSHSWDQLVQRLDTTSASALAG